MKNTPQTLLVGIDGGASKTVLRLVTLEGRTLSEVRGGPANIASDTAQAVNSIRTACQEALAQAGLSADMVTSGALRLVAGAGLAGAEVSGCAAHVRALCPEFAEMTIRTDAFTSCLGAHEGRDGAIVAVGTGTVGFALHGEETRRVGGWGFPQSDEGGGAWIGLVAIRHMLKVADGRQPTSRLARRLRAHLAGEGEKDPLTWSVGATAAEFASVTPLVVALAQEGEDVSGRILDAAAREVAEIGRALLAGMQWEALPLGLVGGLAETLLSRWPAEVCGLPFLPSTRAIDGAVAMARSVVGNP